MLIQISGIRPSYDKNGNSYPTCGLTCAGKYKIAARGSHGSGLGHGTAWLCVMSRLTTSKQNLRRRSSTILDMSSLRVLLSGLCCISHLRHDLSQYSLFWRGRQHEMQCEPQSDIPLAFPVNCAFKCQYCYRRAKLRPHNQCGQTCRDGSRVNCLMCCCRANFEYDPEDHGDSPGPCHMENRCASVSSARRHTRKIIG